MSDYIKRQDVIDIIHKEIESTKSYIEHNTQINIKFAVEELPTLDEKEIIRRTLERIIERLEARYDRYFHGEDDYCEGYNNAIGKAIKIVKEEGGIE